LASVIEGIGFHGSALFSLQLLLPTDAPMIAPTRTVVQPSAESLRHQAFDLREELERISDQDHPTEAQRIRDLFLAITEGILVELNVEPGPIAAAEIDEKILALGKTLRAVYSWLRYVKTSSPSQTPPAIQIALTSLVQQHFPHKNGEPITLVRPKWKYNFESLPLRRQFNKTITTAAFPAIPKAKNPDEVLEGLWTNFKHAHPERFHGKRSDEGCPRQIGILSFAGLDTKNILLAPLLTHELGHFIDFSYTPPLFEGQPFIKASASVESQVEGIMHKNTGNTPDRHDLQRAAFPYKDRVNVCMRELLSDLLATRMLGLAYFVALAELLKRLAPWPQDNILTDGDPSGYPGIRFRLAVVHHHLLSAKYPGNIGEFLSSYKLHADFGEIAKPLLEYLETWRAEFGTVLAAPNSPEPQSLSEIPWRVVQSLSEELEDLAVAQIPNDRCARLTESFFDRINRLRHYMPPTLATEVADPFPEIMAAAWSHQILGGEKYQQTLGPSEGYEEFRTICRIVSKAVELIPFINNASKEDAKLANITWPDKAPVARWGGDGNEKTIGDDDVRNVAGVLSGREISRRLRQGVSHTQHLGIVPVDQLAVQAASYDVRLGPHFALFRGPRLAGIRPSSRLEATTLRTVGMERIYVSSGGTFLLHPGMFALGATLEFVALPGDLTAFVEGKSRLGRMGLVIATATPVAPGFHGVLVLEMANMGTVPLAIEPGMWIGQLVFHTITDPLPTTEQYRRQYHCQIEP